MDAYQGLGLNVIGVDASESSSKTWKVFSDPEKKRKIIGRDFVVEVFNAEQRNNRCEVVGNRYHLSDRIESLSITV